MAAPIDELIKIRRDKLARLQKLGLSGFPAWAPPAGGWRLTGRLTAIRGHGGLIFADLVNQSGKHQISFKKDKLEKDWPIVELVDIGDFIGVNGDDYTTQAGEPTIDVSQLTLLTKSLRPLPSEWYGLKDIEERYRQRYVDLLINPGVRKVFEIRTQVINLLRDKLDNAGFMETETPVLQSVYGGATAKPFITHHNALDIDLYLRISDELYLKRLIVGGFEKVYELSKVFRNEGVDRQHNPEFTMLEFYWAYANYEDLMKFTEELLSGIIKEVAGSYKVIYQGQDYDFTPPWQRITFRDMFLADTGIDVDRENTEGKLLAAIKAKKIAVDLTGVVGYGPLLDKLYKQVSRPKIAGPVFLVDHPLAMRPLAKKKAGSADNVASFQLLVAGFEWISAYNELNDPDDQRARWAQEMELAKEGLEEYQVPDQDYIRTLEYGMPPTAGWGLGVDRFVAFLTNQHTIKDTILFPTLRPEK